MSVESNSATDSSTDLENNVERQPLIDSDILVNENLITDKQRRVLLATSAFVGRHDVSFSAIARNAGVATSYVPYVLVQFIDRGDLPSDCNILERCTDSKSYEDLTQMQRQIINETVINSDLSQSEIAELVDCSESHVQHTQIIYSDIVENRREAICQ